MMTFRSDPETTTPSGHHPDCEWHAEQYPHECNCRLRVSLTKEKFPDAELISIGGDENTEQAA
jgi:hypothetical protein